MALRSLPEVAIGVAAQAATRAALAVLSFPTANNLRLVVTPSPNPVPDSFAGPLPHPLSEVSAPDGDATRNACNARHAALLAAAAQGNARAFETFYSQTLGAATAVVRRVIGPNHLEDVLSDAYFQAWQQSARFDAQRGNALTWLLTICRSRALDRLRAEKLRHDGHAGAPEFDAQEAADDACPGPDSLLESTQASCHLHSALARLSGNERWVLGLAYFRDLSHSEIASLTQLPLGTIKSLISRSQHKLREAMQPL